MAESSAPTNRWSARPGVARLIRVVVYLLPVAISVVAAWVASDVVPSPAGFSMRVVRWMGIAACSTLVLVWVDKLARHLLPLATLFGLTLAFPDQAPSRFKIALRTGSTTQLKKRIEDARAGKVTATPAAAAEHVLELVMALSLHDRLTRGHSERVRAYTQMIGEEMGFTDVELDRLRWSGLLHDIGKLKVSEAILNKPGKLTAAEFEEIKRHPGYGREIVAPLLPWLGESAKAVWEHHERWDGGGYPLGLARTDISLAGRIVAVADTFDVITSVRSYKKAMPAVDARAELMRCSGTQFDPVVVRAFMNLSLGRLRLAMGPLSWMAQLPLFPQTLAATAATGGAGAATALVGAAAATVGLGLSSDPFLPPLDRVEAETAVFNPPGRDPETIVDNSIGTTIAEFVVDGVATTVDTQPTGTTEPPAPETTPAVATTTTPTTTITTTTTTTAAARTTTTTTGPGVTLPGGVTIPTVTVPTVTIPGVTVPGGTPTTAAPTSSAPTTAAPTTAAPTTAAPTTPAPTTTQPRPAWLPAPNVATPLYLDLPGFALSRTAPTGSSSPDADNDGRAGVTLARGGSAVSFALAAPTEARVAGPVTAVIHAGSTQLLQLSVTVRARLQVCDASGTCTLLAERSASAFTLTPLVALPINLDFGSIDAVIPAGGSLRIMLDVPSSSAGDGVLLPDATLTPSALTVRFP